MEFFLEVILDIMLVLLAISIETVILWGVGNLVIWVFNINYTWTIWHGLICALFYRLLKGIFNK